MEVPGHITFGAGPSGGFQFGLVPGGMDCHSSSRTAPRMEFTWHGFDEGDALSGRGHAVIAGDELSI